MQYHIVYCTYFLIKNNFQNVMFMCISNVGWKLFRSLIGLFLMIAVSFVSVHILASQKADFSEKFNS